MTEVVSGVWKGYTRYKYDGPVLNTFGVCVKDKWLTETYAVSKKKARTNMMWQFKKAFRFDKKNKITLPGIITEI